MTKDYKGRTRSTPLKTMPRGTGISMPGLASANGGSTSGGGGGGGEAEVAAAPVALLSDEEVIGGYVNTLYSAYKPTPLVYEAQSEESLRAQIEAWLRPSYEKAILSRQERTRTYRAELDADAISRGMGASSYVTDVKSRQMLEESRDVAMLESEYGATLAQTLSERMEEENKRALEVAMQNQANDHDAYMRAYSAALTMFAAYKAAGGASSGSGGGGGGGGRKSSSSASEIVPTSYANCEAFLAMLSPEERRTVYEASTPQGQQYKAELLASVSMSEYYRLYARYQPSD